MSINLPPNWVERQSKRYSNKKYYFNIKTGEQSWNHPCESDTELKHRRSAKKFSPRREMGKRKKKSNEEENAKVKQTIYVPNKQPSSTPIILASGEKPNFTVTKRTKFMPQKNSNKMTINSPVEKRETKKRKIINVVHDVEMLDLTVSDDDQGTSEGPYIIPVKQCKIEPEPQTSNSLNLSYKSVIVIDTNVLLESFSISILNDFVRKFENSLNKESNSVVVIPWMVLQELDGLKKSKASAKTAISFLNRQFSKRLTCVRGQTIFEAATIIDGFTSSCNDDDILHCCLVMQRSFSGHDIILATADKNLENKALVNHLRCIRDLKVLEKVKYSEAPKPNRKPKRSAHEAKKIIHENMLDELTFYLKSCLSDILKEEMIRIYGELWIDIVLVKPPWNLRDIFKCYKKHWLALFVPLSIPRIMQTFLEKLTKFFNESQLSYSNVDVGDYSHCAFVFLKTLQKHGKYNSCINEDIDAVEKIHSRFLSNKADNNGNIHRPSVAHDSGMEDEIEEPTLTVKENGIVVLWKCLDKIWTAILCHCGIVFQSLSFLPPPNRLSPELKEVLISNYDNLPSQEVAARSLPLISNIMDNLIQCLDRFINATSVELHAALTDLLQCLWMITRGFAIEANMQCLEDVDGLQCLLVEDSSTSNRINSGYRQLLNAYHTVEDCKRHFKIV